MARNFATLEDLDFTGKRVLVRVDFNVPLDNGKVVDDTRIRAALPTIRALLDREAKQVIVMSHLGRPKGEVKPELSLAPVAQRLQELLDQPVSFLDDCLGEIPDSARIVLLENLRFYKEEKANDPEFAKRLASHADVYVNDAFGTAHRAHASVVGVPEYLPGCAGLLMEKELDMLSQVLKKPKRPIILVLGGIKMKTKLPVIENFLLSAECILLAGGTAFTFLAEKGYSLGTSPVERDFLEKAKQILESSDVSGKVVLPSDFVVADAPTEESKTDVVPADKIPKEWAAYDIGPQTVKDFIAKINDAGTVIWNGPLGMYEVSKFSEGTNKIATFLAEITGDVYVGGGDLVAAIQRLGLSDKYAHLSTGGGAFLDFLAGKTLPAVAALEQAKSKIAKK